MHGAFRAEGSRGPPRALPSREGPLPTLAARRRKVGRGLALAMLVKNGDRIVPIGIAKGGLMPAVLVPFAFRKLLFLSPFKAGRMVVG